MHAAGADVSLADIQTRIQSEQATFVTVVNVLDLAVRRLQVLMAEREVSIPGRLVEQLMFRNVSCSTSR